jgi:hypothetical protein
MPSPGGLFLGARAPPRSRALLDWFEETAATLRSNLRTGTPMCCGAPALSQPIVYILSACCARAVIGSINVFSSHSSGPWASVAHPAHLSDFEFVGRNIAPLTFSSSISSGQRRAYLEILSAL